MPSGYCLVPCSEAIGAGPPPVIGGLAVISASRSGLGRRALETHWPYPGLPTGRVRAALDAPGPPSRTRTRPTRPPGRSGLPGRARGCGQWPGRAVVMIFCCCVSQSDRAIGEAASHQHAISPSALGARGTRTWPKPGVSGRLRRVAEIPDPLRQAGMPALCVTGSGICLAQSRVRPTLRPRRIGSSTRSPQARAGRCGSCPRRSGRRRIPSRGFRRTPPYGTIPGREPSGSCSGRDRWLTGSFRPARTSTTWTPASLPRQSGGGGTPRYRDRIAVGDRVWVQVTGRA